MKEAGKDVTYTGFILAAIGVFGKLCISHDLPIQGKDSKECMKHVEYFNHDGTVMSLSCCKTEIHQHVPAKNTHLNPTFIR